MGGRRGSAGRGAGPGVAVSASDGGGRDGRGAAGRRRPPPAHPPGQGARARAQLGRATLILGALIVLFAFVLPLLRDDGDGPPPLVSPLTGTEAVSLESLVRVAVVQVIDGDTLDVRTFDGGLMRVRLFGIDAPERGERCAGEATLRLRQLAADEVYLLPDERQRDPGGRELRYLFATDGASVDAALVSEGLAEAWRDGGAMRDELVALEQSARDGRRGCLWSEQ